MAEITDQGRNDNNAWVAYKSMLPIKKTVFNFTKDTGTWEKRRWESVPAKLNPALGNVTAELPEGVSVYYFNIIDDRGLIISSPHVELR